MTTRDRHIDPEVRFARATRPGRPPDFRPDLGPCLLFIGSTSGGYGQFRYDDRNGYAHRYAWERVNGPIPDGLTIDHLCRVRNCVEPGHMELVDAVTNYLRGAAVRTHCPNEHEYAQPFTPGMKRRCPVCQRRGQARSGRKRNRSVNGLPDRRVEYDQTLVATKIADVRRAALTIAEASREIGCNPNYLGRRVWRETRADVLARDGACLRCGATGPLDVHHRIPRGLGGASRPEIAFGMANLVTLCRQCHTQVESGRAQAFDDGYLVHRGSDPAARALLTVRGRVLLSTAPTTGGK